MSKNGSMKERTLDKLREESSTIYQGTRLIVFLNALFAITCIIMLVLSFVFSSTVTEMRSDTAHRGFPFIVHTFAYLVTSGDVYTETGAFNYGYYILSMAAQLFSAGIIAYIFHTISRVFKSILDGGTPFVDTCITEWKRCYRFFSLLTIIYFLASFILRPLILAMISPLLAACFFYSLSLIFEYGAQLQQESDETL